MVALQKVILILLDACGFDAAGYCAGYLEGLVENGKAAKYCVAGGLPSSSRPMYESMLTGLRPDEHGTFVNDYLRGGAAENLFALTKNSGLVNAAAAYYWISELYNRNGPFDMECHRMQLESDGDIQHGIFYWEDFYPDSHVIMDGEYLRQQYKPDFLFLHTMCADYMGHMHGSASREYLGALIRAFEAVARMLGRWREDGYDVVVTADHGMDEMGLHCGNSSLQRMVPLYVVSDRAEPGNHTQSPVSNLNVAPLVLKLLGVEPGGRMLPRLEIKGEF